MSRPTPQPELKVVSPAPPALPKRLDAHSPLYTQIKDILRTRILEGVYQPHQQMPSESDMTSTFSVSRITVRQALRDLESEGLIFRVHGKGTFVSRPRAFQDLGSLQGFGKAMRQKGYETHSKVLSVRTLRCPPQVQDKLGLPSNSKVTELRRLRFLNREPISVDVSYLPENIGNRLAKADLANRDVFEILENDFQITLGHAELQISSRIADETLAQQLRMSEGESVLFIERTIHTADGAPLEFELLYYRGESFQFRVRVDRATADPAG
jgi:GntR family transcriptional regulator